MTTHTNPAVSSRTVLSLPYRDHSWASARTLMDQVASRRGMNKGKQGLCPDLALARLSSPGSPWFPLSVIIFLTGLLSSQ
jgi:hypothetical protein